MEVKCPTCGKPAQFVATNKFRPFCSRRCATLDLGAWADERYKVPAFEQDSDSVNEKSDQDSRTTDDFVPRDRQN